MNIDTSKTYNLKEYQFKNFIILDDSEKKMIWEWRNDPEIAKWMINQDFIPLENHLSFITSLIERTDKLYWLVYKNNKPTGVVNMIDINWEQKSGFFGLYLNPEYIDSGEGLNFSYYCRSFFYNMLNFEKITGEIIFGNTKALQLSMFFRVKPVGSIVNNGLKYLKMEGCRKEFNELKDEKLIRQFVKFAVQQKVDWEVLEKRFK